MFYTLLSVTVDLKFSHLLFKHNSVLISISKSGVPQGFRYIEDKKKKQKQRIKCATNFEAYLDVCLTVRQGHIGLIKKGL